MKCHFFTSEIPTTTIQISLSSKPSLQGYRYRSTLLIRKVTAKFYGMSQEQLISPSRPADLAWCRQVGMYLARKLTRHSLVDIGQVFGGRDHGTVIYAVNKVEGVTTIEPDKNKEVQTLRRICKKLLDRQPV